MTYKNLFCKQVIKTRSVFLFSITFLYGWGIDSTNLAYQESPSQGSSESGIGLIRGWACNATKVEIEIDGGERLLTAHGTKREDTAAVCGDTDNGYGLVFNWNRLGNGTHTLRTLVDGVEVSNVTFHVTTLGVDFLQGEQGEYILSDFPNPGNNITVRWSETHQNFVIVNFWGTPASSPCTNIAGIWNDPSGVATMACTIPGGTKIVSGTVSIEQSGCNIRYYVPELNILRQGKIEENNLSISGPFAVPLQDGVVFNQNNLSLNGTVAQNQITLSGSGTATGTSAGTSFSCSASKSGTSGLSR